ncbi:MAG: Gfo/Idh/MocA family oxidoreductase [Deltaproteobacteria bacterium]|jgi:predicted dehydrogenase|nr:Gfo/Idh/MocA family oxidoreductase [Deltaproteobacteria bacterium]
MSDSIGAIVVGTGFGVLTHLRAMRAAGIEVKALVGRNLEKARKRAELFDVPHGLDSLDEALSLPGVDAVAVSTPPHTHAAIVLAAVAAGKHVVCEKPFAASAAEGQRMLEAAERAGVVHLLGTEFRWATGQALATRAIAQGVIGEPRMVTFLFQMPGLAAPDAEVPDWWRKEEEGGGWLGAYASHIIDQVRVTVGEFAGVSASLRAVAQRPEATPWTADDSYSVHFRTRTGVDGILQSSAAARGPLAACTRFVGSTGTLWIEGDQVGVADASGERILEVPADLEMPPPKPPPAELLSTTYDMLHSMGIDLGPYTRLYETFRDRILGRPVPDDPQAATFVDGVAIQAVLDAIRLSSKEKRWIEIG